MTAATSDTGEAHGPADGIFVARGAGGDTVPHPSEAASSPAGVAALGRLVGLTGVQPFADRKMIWMPRRCIVTVAANSPKYARHPELICPTGNGLPTPSPVRRSGARWTCATATRRCPIPWTPSQKLEYFQLLCEIGFKHIEVGVPVGQPGRFRLHPPADRRGPHPRRRVHHGPDAVPPAPDRAHVRGVARAPSAASSMPTSPRPTCTCSRCSASTGRRPSRWW